jgi:hypothetical protein
LNTDNEINVSNDTSSEVYREYPYKVNKAELLRNVNFFKHLIKNNKIFRSEYELIKGTYLVIDNQKLIIDSTANQLSNSIYDTSIELNGDYIDYVLSRYLITRDLEWGLWTEVVSYSFNDEIRKRDESFMRLYTYNFTNFEAKKTTVSYKARVQSIVVARLIHLLIFGDLTVNELLEFKYLKFYRDDANYALEVLQQMLSSFH